jgi:hypothetical protein
LEFRKGAILHTGASTCLPLVKQVKVRDAITQTTGSLGALTEVFSPFAEEA